jgi:hypothetical protein
MATVSDERLRHLGRVERQAELTVKAICTEHNLQWDTDTDNCSMCPVAEKCMARTLSDLIKRRDD